MQPAAWYGLVLLAGSAWAQPASTPTPTSTPAPPPAPTSPSPTAPASGRPAAARAEAYVLTVRALDSAQAGRELHEQLMAAVTAKAPAVVLLVNPSMPWRSDVLRDALLELKECRTTVAVYLEPGELKLHGRAGWGAVALGLASTRWGSAEALTVAVARDEEARGQAPEKTDWSAVEADLRELLAPHVARRGWLDGSLDVLLWPRDAWWVVTTSTGAAQSLVKGTEPAASEGRRAARITPGSASAGAAGFEVALSRLVGPDGESPRTSGTWDAFCKAEKIKAPAHPVESTGVPVSEVRLGVERALEQVALVRRQSDAAIDEAERKDAATAARTGTRELARLNGAVAAIKVAETMLERYPELLRTVPPGKTAVAAKPSSQASRWRTLVQGHRDAVEKLQERARALEGRKP